MSDQPTSSDPYGQPPSSGPSGPPSPDPSGPSGPSGSSGPSGPSPQPGAYQQPPPQPSYGQGYTGGYPAPAAPRKPLDLPKLVGIAAWVVLGLFALWYLYFISNDDNGGEFVDRFFGGLDVLGTGIFYSGILHAVAVWLGRNTPA